ncbi:unnamed protein product [Cladocopium goreaui]|uniref:TPR and ankyrin repeat-containing protein 1 n=1 Tax=Cladocopium goreaui TaxID=2562237 RepID=A0A9P1DIM5_9DINO|nr:unnamed protein product [Cladocopium goreaui]
MKGAPPPPQKGAAPSQASKAKAAPPAARSARLTTGQRIEAKDLYGVALYEKQDLLYNLDRRQFNNTVLQSMSNEDLSDPRQI